MNPCRGRRSRVALRHPQDATVGSALDGELAGLQDQAPEGWPLLQHRARYWPPRSCARAAVTWGLQRDGRRRGPARA
jgi:hypothetical protein